MTAKDVNASEYFEVGTHYVCRKCKKEYEEKEMEKNGCLDNVDFLDYIFFNVVEAADHVKQAHVADFIEVIFKGEPTAVGA